MRRYFVLLICMGILGTGIIYHLLPAPKPPFSLCNAKYFHKLIETYPPDTTVCVGAEMEDIVPDQATYRLEIRIVQIPIGSPTCSIPPLSGYLTDVSFFQFMEGVMGDIRCSTLQWPAATISNAQTVTFNDTPVKIQVKKTNDHFELNYTQASGNTYTQEFDLPEGIAFATNLVEHPVISCRYRRGPSILSSLPFLDPLFTETVALQRELFLLLKYHEIEVDKK
jgi:hypothetical protein